MRQKKDHVFHVGSNKRKHDGQGFPKSQKRQVKKEGTKPFNPKAFKGKKPVVLLLLLAAPLLEKMLVTSAKRRDTIKGTAQAF